MTSVLNRPIVDSMRPLSSASPTVATEPAIPASTSASANASDVHLAARISVMQQPVGGELKARPAPAEPGLLHAGAIYLQAREEARRRGDRRTGTDHILLALFDDPSIEAVLG